MADNLIELLAEFGIRLKSHWPGHNEHVLCPVCEGGRTKEKSLSVTIDADGEGATWICHRGNCTSKPNGARLNRERRGTVPDKSNISDTR